MKYPENTYSKIKEKRGHVIKYDYKPYNGYYGRGAQCGKGEDVYTAAERLFGKCFVDVFGPRPLNFAPLLENVKKYGDPIGTVTVRPNESYYVFRLP